MRTPKVTWIDSTGTLQTKIFTAKEFLDYHTEWEKDSNEFKNPFTGDITEKVLGFYLTATIYLPATAYATIDKFGFGGMWSKNSSDVKLYPDSTSGEAYPVKINGPSWDDWQGKYAKDIELTFKSKRRYDEPANQTALVWGRRDITFADHYRFNGTTF